MASSSATVSSTLWAHLLRKDKPSTSIQAMSSPIAPADKTGTSVRLLLHDTQATMEKFSEKVDKLISGVQDAQEKSRAKDHDWAEGVDRSTTSIVREAANKCTTELQKLIGEPSQVSQLKELRQELDSHVDCLNKKMETIQMLNQTQSQSLQTIQDQQAQILTLLLPLLPLLQAVPLHVDCAKNDLKETIRAEMQAPTTNRSHKRKTPLSSSPENLVNKRARLEVGKQLPSPTRSHETDVDTLIRKEPAVEIKTRTPSRYLSSRHDSNILLATSRSSKAIPVHKHAQPHSKTPLRQTPSRLVTRTPGNLSTTSAAAKSPSTTRKITPAANTSLNLFPSSKENNVTSRPPLYLAKPAVQALCALHDFPLPQSLHAASNNQLPQLRDAQVPAMKQGKRFISLTEDDDEDEDEDNY